jgi:hypothetical protein
MPAMAGEVEIATSPSTGSSQSSTTVIPSASRAACTTAPSDSENSSPTAVASPVTRVTRSPFWRRW